MKLLDLSGFANETVKDLGFDVITKTDFMNWAYKYYPSKYFEVICWNEDSTDYDVDDIYVVMDILEYFEPKYWIITNPTCGKLKDDLLMYGLPYMDVTCDKMRVWNNVFKWQPKPLETKNELFYDILKTIKINT